MSWIDYVTGYLVNYTDQSTAKTATNVCEHGAIIGNQDGAMWASTPGFTLETYTTEIEKEDGSGTEKVEINEFAHLLDAFNNGGRSSMKGGIRLHKEKYYVVSSDAEKGVLYLKRNGGGACVAKSGQGFVIGTWSSKCKFKNFNGVEEVQNPGVINRATEDLQKFLLDNSL